MANPRAAVVFPLPFPVNTMSKPFGAVTGGFLSTNKKSGQRRPLDYFRTAKLEYRVFYDASLAGAGGDGSAFFSPPSDVVSVCLDVLWFFPQ
jgi:hypothetical protein